MTSGAGWPGGDPNAVIRTILAQPIYRDAQAAPAAAQSPLARLLHWLWSMLQRLFPHVPASAAKAAGTLTLWLIVIAAAAVLGFVVYGIVAQYAGRDPRVSAAGAAAGPIVERSAADLRAEAAAHAARGDYARAIAALFVAALIALDERAVVPFDTARTPGEYRRAVRRALGGAAQPFDDLAQRFVRASYASAPALRDDYDAALRSVSALAAAGLA